MTRADCALVAIATALMTAGCVTTPLVLEPEHVDTHLDAHATRLVCDVGPYVLEDARARKSVGTLGGKEVRFDRLQSTVENELARSVRVDPSGSAFEVRILRAHLEQHPSSFSFNLVLRASEPASGSSRTFRGVASGMVWWGTEEEFGEYVARAAQDAVARLLAHVGTCTPNPEPGRSETRTSDSSAASRHARTSVPAPTPDVASRTAAS